MKYDWVFMGDSSRYEFLRWLLPKFSGIEKIKIHPLYFFHANKFSFEEHQNVWYIGTYYLLPGQWIYVPVDGEDILQEAFETDSFQYCAYFEKFPFGRETTFSFAEDWQNMQNEIPLLIVSMNIPHAYASTDGDTPDESAQRAEQKFKERCFSHVMIQSANQVLQVLHWHQDCISRAVASLYNVVQYLKMNAESFSSLYQSVVDKIENQVSGVLSMKNMQSYTDLIAAQAGSTNYLWSRYTEAAEKKLFKEGDSNGFWALLEIYQELTMGAEILFSQSLEQRKIHLWRQIEDQWLSFMKCPAKYQILIQPEQLSSDFSYMEYKNSSQLRGIDVYFRRKLVKFLKVKAEEVCKNFLQNEIDDIEKKMMISE